MPEPNHQHAEGERRKAERRQSADGPVGRACSEMAVSALAKLRQLDPELAGRLERRGGAATRRSANGGTEP